MSIHAAYMLIPRNLTHFSRNPKHASKRVRLPSARAQSFQFFLRELISEIGSREAIEVNIHESAASAPMHVTALKAQGHAAT